MQIEINYENLSKIREWIAISIASFTAISWLLYWYSDGLYDLWTLLFVWIPWDLRKSWMAQIFIIFLVIHVILLYDSAIRKLVGFRKKKGAE